MNKRAFIALGTLILGAAAISAQSPLQQQMLGHVEKILVVDTIDVDKDAFFKKYRLSPSTGKILDSKDIVSIYDGADSQLVSKDRIATGFTNEFNDYMIWATEDSTGHYRLAESVRLVDGSWSLPILTTPTLNFGKEVDEETEVNHNATFPFMSDDGITLYFAADNDFSLGGYDIFVAKKDQTDGSFLIPGNIGMPFNSPYDDYMMVIDSNTGVGWWASDRNQLDDRITIYIYALTEDRINVDPSDEKLMAYATLSGWQDLLDDEAKARIDSIRREIQSIRPESTLKPEFYFPMPGGKAYRNYNDFKNSMAASLMKKNVRESSELEKLQSRLRKLREDYYKSGGDKRMGGEIESLENHIREKEVELKELQSEIYRYEIYRK